MNGNDDKSSVEIVIGPNEIRINGSEKFVSEELEALLEKVDLTKSVEPLGTQTPSGMARVEKEELIEHDQEDGENAVSSSESSIHDPLNRVAESLNVPPGGLKDQFYLDETEDNEDGELEIHIMYPTKIPQKYALLGYCTIKEELTGQTYFDNKATKEKLVDGEKVPIEYWGRKLVHNLRNEGLIKDDPNSDKKRNRPFKVTPKGRSQFVEWVRQQV